MTIYKKSKTELPQETRGIEAREILDSRGNPTIEVELTTNFGRFLASVPSGVSRGKYEAVEARDGGKRYQGKGVLKAVKNVNEIIGPKLKGRDVTEQNKLDDLMIELDGTKNKSKLGANAILGVSMAVCRAGAAAKGISLYKHISEISGSKLQVSGFKIPTPCFNMIEGGAHAGNELDFQEFMIVPQEKNFSKNLEIASRIYHQLKEILVREYGKKAVDLGDEGGFSPPVKSPRKAIELILKAAKKLNYENKIKIILDVAASQFFENGRYKMKIGNFTRENLMRYYSKLISKYPILGLEDPFSEDDWEAWKIANCKLQIANCLIIGDDLTATNPQRIKLAHERGACNAVILKLNQIGTVSEAVEAAKMASRFGWKIIVSHRAGETCDDFISDLAVGIKADFIKAGGPARGERVAKYNRLLRIEEGLKTYA